jgi:O-antigen chain-terminating methyltransferase
VLIYFLRVITVDQQQFNRLVLGALRELAGDAGALRRRLDGVAPQLESARAERDAILAQVGDLSDALAAEREQRSGLSDALAAQLEQVRAHAAALAELRDTGALLLTQTGALKRRLALAREAGTAADTARRGGDAAAVTPAPAVDRRLLADAFRGTESSIRDRQRRYVAYFEGCTNVLDVGCGRGEFLHLLREAGIGAQGVDLDDDLVLWCRERGLAVRCADALQYLAALPDGELDGIFSAQVVEHLRTDDLLRFIDLAYQKLRPEGRIVIETLNPESLLVLYRWFWMDLTHERLVHPDTLMFVLRSVGFRDVECDFLAPPAGPLHVPQLHFPVDPPAQLQEFNAATQYLNRLLYGSFDYAVVAVR